MNTEIAGHRRSRIIPFFFVGALSSLVDIGLMYYFTTYLGIWYLYSATLSYCCGIVVNYLVNKYFTFSPLAAKILATCCAFFWSYHGQSRFTFRDAK